MSLIDSGITLACTDQNTRGGIAKIWVANRDNISDFTAGADHEYSSVTMNGTGDVFFEFEFFDFTAQHTAEGELGDSGSSTLNNTIEAFIPRREKVKATQIQQAFTSCKVVVIYQTFNSNKKFVVGHDEVLGEKAALRANVTEVTGTVNGDQNGYTLSFTGVSGEVAREFTGSVPT